MAQEQHEKVIVIDFGGQYNQLVARRVRECSVYCEIYSYRTPLDQIRQMNPKGIILTGGPNSVYEEGAATAPKELFEMGIPVLGLCYGAQLMQYVLGGDVKRAEEREYGKTEMTVDAKDSPLFKDIPEESIVWMSHNDYISKMAPGFTVAAHTANCPYAAVENRAAGLFGFQYHPEVLHTQYGTQMIRNFVLGICGCAGDWKMEDFAERTIREIREKVGDGKALCALSGGVDSSVAAVLMSKAIGKNLTCVFVDHGLLRKDEGDMVSEVFGPDGPYDLNFVRVDASEKFFNDLKGVTEPEKKRKIIGEDFIRVFEQEAKKIGKVDYLVQGTIYPDVVESGLGGESATIKSHHNVGGLPDYVDFREIIEPLRYLFKDEVRKVGRHLGIPEKLVNRQPFPGPGLGIRIIGEVTPDKVKIVQDADAIFREEMDAAGINKVADQYYAALTNIRTVGVMGDERTYDYAVALRAVSTVDFMTADAVEIPYPVLKKVTNRIVNEVNHVNRVFYDVTSKPPATIELE
ncbi:MAG: glutamine-hydrolyzing GMP synthase [Eubacteriales bacterium]|jgi:GMP synthase (glutamine-hydrolysing)